MSIKLVILVWWLGAVVGGVMVQWANDRAELNKLKASRTHTKKVNKTVLNNKGDL